MPVCAKWKNKTKKILFFQVTKNSGSFKFPRFNFFDVH